MANAYPDPASDMEDSDEDSLDLRDLPTSTIKPYDFDPIMTQEQLERRTAAVTEAADLTDSSTTDRNCVCGKCSIQHRGPCCKHKRWTRLLDHRLACLTDSEDYQAFVRRLVLVGGLLTSKKVAAADVDAEIPNK